VTTDGDEIKQLFSNVGQEIEIDNKYMVRKSIGPTPAIWFLDDKPDLNEWIIFDMESGKNFEI